MAIGITGSRKATASEIRWANSELRSLAESTQLTGFGENEDTDPVTWLMEGYAHFALARNYKATPFWQASRELYKMLNAEGPPSGFLWSNLVKVDQKVDQKVGRPTDAVEEAVSNSDC